MQVNKTNNTSVNFGMKCSPKIKMQIADCFPRFGEPYRLFKNSTQLADEIDTIGSKNTSLERFDIKRNIGENFYDGATEIWDECKLLFKMLAPNGKQEKVTAQIRSKLSGEPLADIYKDFIKVTKMAEETFLSGYMLREANKGNLKPTAKALLDMYPARTEHICNEYSRKDLNILNDKAKKLKETSILKRIASFFIGD